MIARWCQAKSKTTKIEITVYRKSTRNEIYLNWGLFEPVTWKKVTPKMLFNKLWVFHRLSS